MLNGNHQYSPAWAFTTQPPHVVALVALVAFAGVVEFHAMDELLYGGTGIPTVLKLGAAVIVLDPLVTGDATVSLERSMLLLEDEITPGSSVGAEAVVGPVLRGTETEELDEDELGSGEEDEEEFVVGPSLANGVVDGGSAGS